MQHALDVNLASLRDEMARRETSITGLTTDLGERSEDVVRLEGELAAARLAAEELHAGRLDQDTALKALKRQRGTLVVLLALTVAGAGTVFFLSRRRRV